MHIHKQYARLTTRNPLPGGGNHLPVPGYCWPDPIPNRQAALDGSAEDRYNYLYTAEAFDLYLARLSEQGILNVMRLEFPQPREMLRALVTAVGALRRSGVSHPADHLVTVSATSGTFTALLVKKSPWSEPELDRLAAWADTSPFFDLSAAPRRDTGSNLYRVFLELGTPERERAFVAAYPFDISPTTDDRPFFFQFGRWSNLQFFGPGWRENPLMHLYTL